MKLRSLAELFEIISNPPKWQGQTLLGAIGVLGMLINLTLFSIGNMPPRFIWNLFPVATLAGCSIEIAQSLNRR